MSYQLLVFDWDGTIIDSASAIVDCICAAARDTGIPVPPRERAAHTIGLGLHDALRFAVPDLPAERYADFLQVGFLAFARSDGTPQDTAAYKAYRNSAT